jgi:hypothetical protein
VNKGSISASMAGEVSLGGELSVNRLGFGAMRLTGEGIWGHQKTGLQPYRFCAAPSNST